MSHSVQIPWYEEQYHGSDSTFPNTPELMYGAKKKAGDDQMENQGTS